MDSKSRTFANCGLCPSTFRADRFVVEQVSLVAAAGRIADHSRTVAQNDDGLVTRALESGQRDQRHQVAKLKAVGSRIEPAVDDYGFFVEQPAEVRVRRVVNQTSRFQFTEQSRRLVSACRRLLLLSAFSARALSFSVLV